MFPQIAYTCIVKLHLALITYFIAAFFLLLKISQISYLSFVCRAVDVCFVDKFSSEPAQLAETLAYATAVAGNAHYAKDLIMELLNVLLTT